MGIQTIWESQLLFVLLYYTIIIDSHIITTYYIQTYPMTNISPYAKRVYNLQWFKSNIRLTDSNNLIIYWSTWIKTMYITGKLWGTISVRFKTGLILKYSMGIDLQGSAFEAIGCRDSPDIIHSDRFSISILYLIYISIIR